MINEADFYQNFPTFLVFVQIHKLKLIISGKLKVLMELAKYGKRNENNVESVQDLQLRAYFKLLSSNHTLCKEIQFPTYLVELMLKRLLLLFMQHQGKQI